MTNWNKEFKSGRKYFANTGWLIGERVLRLVVTVLVTPLIARHLEPAGFGNLSYVVGFVGLFNPIALLGLDDILLRGLVREPASQLDQIGTAFFLRIGGTLGMWCVLGLLTFLIPNDDPTRVLIALVAFGSLFQAATVLEFYFQARVESRYVVYAQIAQLSAMLITRLLLISAGAEIVYFAAAVAFDAFLFALSLFWIYRRRGGKPYEWRWRSTLAWRLLKDAWPLMLAQFMISVYLRIDTVMIKEILGVEATGEYAAAAKLSEAFYFLPVAITTSLFPAILMAKREDINLYRRRLQQLYDLMITISLVIAVVMALGAPYLIELLFGAPYANAVPVLQVHVWAAVFVFLGVATSKNLLAEGMQKFQLTRTIVGATSNVTLNFVLIPTAGIVGAAVATLISVMISDYLIMAFNKRTSFIFHMETSALLTGPLRLWRMK